MSTGNDDDDDKDSWRISYDGAKMFEKEQPNWQGDIMIILPQ